MCVIARATYYRLSIYLGWWWSKRNNYSGKTSLRPSPHYRYTIPYLNQCWRIIVNWALGKFQWNLNRNSYTFIQENAIENVVCQISGHFVQWGRGGWVNWLMVQQQCCRDACQISEGLGKLFSYSFSTAKPRARTGSKMPAHSKALESPTLNANSAIFYELVTF